jgi:N-acylneuraminate cytidylyltransferase
LRGKAVIAGDDISLVALIPARAGSVRVKDKNIRKLNGIPLIAYSIRCAMLSGVFDRIICATDSEEYAEIATEFGAEVPVLRPANISNSTSPDIDWVRFMLGQLEESGFNPDAFSILRPTSPFRRPETIQRAYKQFRETKGIDSLRAVEPCNQHPGKMWTVSGDIITPLLPFSIEGVPWHSNQKAALPDIFIQNASLEMAWSRVVKNKSISGSIVAPFFSRGLEGFDINEELDWAIAEHYCANEEQLFDWM